MIKVIVKTNEILKYVAKQGDCPVSEISRDLNINKATLSHIVKTLLETKLLERAENGRVSIGPGLLDLAFDKFFESSLVGVAEEYAQSLMREINETAVVGLLRNGERYNIARAIPDKSVTITPQLGFRPGPWRSCIDKVWLAYQSDEEVEKEIQSLKKIKGNKWKIDWNEIKKIRKEGIAFQKSPDQLAESVGAPVFIDKQLVAVLATPVLKHSFKGEKRKTIIETVRNSAKHMSETLKIKVPVKK